MNRSSSAGVRRLAMRASMLALLAFAAGCGSDEPPPAPTPTPLDPATFGVVKGFARLKGPDPAPVALAMGTDVCRDFPPAIDEKWGVAKNGLVKHAFIRVTKGLEGKTFARPASYVEVDQTNCLFSPRVFGVMTGQYVVFKNSDPVAHNVRIDSAKRGTNRTLASKGTSFNWWFGEASADPIICKCDLHPWMTGFGFVLDHPYFAATGDDGSFTIKDLPAGVYELEAWNEAFGRAKAKDVRVEAGKETAISFEFTPPAK
jgi:plastocyanin